jgi:hypothetical protein
MKLHNFVQGMVLAAIVLVAARAFAQPVILTCKVKTHSNNPNMVLWITFDEDSKTAFNGDMPASDASFTNTNIKWSGRFPNPHQADYRMYDYNLNRINGLLAVSLDNDSAVEFNCVVAAEKKF